MINFVQSFAKILRKRLHKLKSSGILILEKVYEALTQISCNYFLDANSSWLNKKKEIEDYE